MASPSLTPSKMSSSAGTSGTNNSMPNGSAACSSAQPPCKNRDESGNESATGSDDSNSPRFLPSTNWLARLARLGGMVTAYLAIDRGVHSLFATYRYLPIAALL